MTRVASSWAEVPIKNVLTYLDERITLDNATEYITITVKRNHGGLEAREKLFGHQIQTQKQFRLIPGAFILSRVQCWHRAYAIVPDDIPANMIASINYDQFAISNDVDPRFFWWLSHSPAFTETVRSSAFGIVIEKMVFNRDAWLEKSIPLPPLEEQRRIVARIDTLAARIEEARGLRREAAEEAENLWASHAQSTLDRLEVPLGALGDVVTLRGGGTPSKTNLSFGEGSIPWVSPKDMKTTEIYDSIDHISEDAINQSAAKLIDPSAVLVVTRGMILAHTVPAAILRIPAAIN